MKKFKNSVHNDSSMMNKIGINQKISIFQKFHFRGMIRFLVNKYWNICYSSFWLVLIYSPVLKFKLNVFFFHKSLYLDMFENRKFGVFALLDECRMPNPRTESFIQKVVSNHQNSSDISIGRQSCEFVIRHFGQSVHYTPVSTHPRLTWND